MDRRSARLCLFLVCVFMALVYSRVDASEVAQAKEQLKITIDHVLETLKDQELSKPEHKAERRRRIMEVVSTRFDFEEMAKRSMGRHWRDRTEEEQESFTPLFRELLSASYMDKIEGYTDEKIVYNNAYLRGPHIWVDTNIVAKQNNIPIVYRMHHKDGDWFVYDIVIEEVSLVSTYRSQFNKIIGGESYEKLVKNLQDKLKELEELDRADPAS